jgi:WD40 repeat protein
MMNLYSGFMNHFMLTDLATDKSVRCNLLEAGLISSFAFHPFNYYYLLGTYDKRIYLMDYKTNKPYSVLERHSGGINNLLFLNDGVYFVSAGRNDNEVLLWDSRTLERPVNSFYRNNPTNQRIGIAIDNSKNLLFCSNHVVFI